MNAERDPREVEVDASHRVLVDVLTVLGAYVDQMVIVGGWVPELVFPKAGHIGSLDVDLALDGRRIQPAAYDTIRTRLMEAGYREKTPGVTNIFVRDVEETGQAITVKLDMITGEHAGPASELSHEHIHGMNVSKLRGTDLALDHAVDVDVTGELPDGGIKQVTARVAAIPAFVCMKAIAMNDRKKPKDAYDILFCLRHYGGGPEDLAKGLMDIGGNPLVHEAVESLRSNFASEDAVGPVWAGQVAAEHGEDEEMAIRDAFERTQALLRGLLGLGPT
jgi:hypothetical protein